MKTLIIYATKHGSVKECASLLSVKLNGHIEECNLKKDRIPDLKQYEKVIIGGSMYAGRIQKEVSEFCINHIQTLKDKKIGLFICCMQEGDLAKKQLREVFPDELIKISIAKEYCGGILNFKDMNFFEKLIMKMVTKNDKSLPPLDNTGKIIRFSEENIEKFVTAMNNA